MSSFLLFILILFILAALLKIDFFFTILYLFVGVFIVLRLWSGRVFKGLSARRAFPQRAFLGDTVSVAVTVENQSRLPIPWLMLDEAIPWALSAASSSRQVVSLKGKESQTLRYTLAARRRGYYQIGPLILNTGDLLGLNRRLTSRLEADHLIVYPKIVPIAELGLPTHSPQVVLPTAIPIFEDPARIIGARNYRWGDSPRHIHWPATAKTGQVMVKQFQAAIARESVIFLNLNRQDYNRREREHAPELAIIAAASLANHILTIEKLPVGLDTVARDPLTKAQQHFHLPPRKEVNYLLQILEVLARIQPADSGDFLANLRQQAVHLSWGATIIIITNHGSEALSETTLWLRQTGFNPAIVLVGRDTRAELAAQLSTPVFEIWGEKDIETWSATL